MSDFLLSILRSHPGLAKIIANPEEYRVQVLLGLIERAADGQFTIDQHGYRVDAEYIYPASTVKLCAAVAALQKINQLSAAHGGVISEHTPLRVHPCFSDQSFEELDPSNLQGESEGKITVHHDIRKIAIVSDNPAHNRLYSLVGHREINERMWALGLRSVRINHRLSDPRSRLENMRTPQVDLLPPKHDPVVVPARTSDLWIDNAGLPGLLVGRAHIQDDRRVEAPMDFTGKNRFGLMDQQRLLAMAVCPHFLQEIDRNNITGPLRLNPIQMISLGAALSELPRTSQNPAFAEHEHPDQYAKFFLPGLARVMPASGIFIANKIGRAYGFSTDNALITTNTERGRPFFLSATIYANSSGLIGADTYDDTTIADPFFADLAEAVTRALWS